MRDEVAARFARPTTEAEVAELVRDSRARGLQVRVRGAAHSVPYAIHTDARLRGQGASTEVLLAERRVGRAELGLYRDFVAGQREDLVLT